MPPERTTSRHDLVGPPIRLSHPQKEERAIEKNEDGFLRPSTAPSLIRPPYRYDPGASLHSDFPGSGRSHAPSLLGFVSDASPAPTRRGIQVKASKSDRR